MNNNEQNFKLRNHMEDVVSAKAGRMMKAQNICCCPMCRMDVMAYALNLLTPKYIVTDKGDLYSRLAEFTPQAEIDVEVALAEAIKVVSNNPRHK